jgi:hypothetical protein
MFVLAMKNAFLRNTTKKYFKPILPSNKHKFKFENRIKIVDFSLRVQQAPQSLFRGKIPTSTLVPSPNDLICDTITSINVTFKEKIF